MNFNRLLPEKEALLRKASIGIITIRTMAHSFLILSKKTLFLICVSIVILVLFVSYFMSDTKTTGSSDFISNRLLALRINETLYFHQYLNMGISFEGHRDCNLVNRSLCYTTKKSLILSFWRESSRDKWITKNLLKIFPESHFTCVVMVHDNSSWASYPNSDKVIWVYVANQRRFWYLKRFLTPVVMKAYEFIWVVDDDIELLFDPRHYECVIAQLNVSFSAPGRLKGIASHVIARVNQDYVKKIGRWTDFVEIGPIVIGSSAAWQCIWHYMSAHVGLGWGLDLIWCRLLANRCSLNSTVERSCAILDSFIVNHLSEYIGSTAIGSQEVPAYHEYFGNFHTRQNNLAPLANDLKLFHACNKTR